jgi:predicted RNA methylase
MRIKTIEIDAEIEKVIRAAKVEGNNLTLQGQLDSKTYVKVMKVLEQIGFKWNKKLKSHIGEGDSAERLTEALEDKKVVNEKQTYQFFETPDTQADKMVKYAEIEDTHSVLEPSAGRGAIVKAIYRGLGESAPRTVHTVELDPKNVKVLKEIENIVVHEQDFMQFTDEVSGMKYDRILMNPPFNGGQDVEHVRHAYDLLKTHGRIVAITSPSWLTKSDRKSASFREWFDELQAWGLAEVREEIESGAFKESGTMVETIMIVLNKE